MKTGRVLVFAVLAVIVVSGCVARTPETAQQEQQLVQKDIAGLTRNYPEFVKCAWITAPELRGLATRIDELKALGHNTICIGVGVDRFNPEIGEEIKKSETLSSIVIFKKAGFAIAINMDLGGPVAQREYTKLTEEQFLKTVEDDALEWAALAEEYKVEYFSTAGELTSALHNVLSDYSEQERQLKKVEKTNEWHKYMLPKVRKVFSGKVVAILGGHVNGLEPQGQDVVSYTSGHSFITNLAQFRNHIKEIYKISIEQANGAEWWVDTYLAYGETFNPDAPIEYTALGAQLRDLQDDYYRIIIEEIDALPPEQRPKGLTGGYIPGSPIWNITKESKEVVQAFFMR